MFNSKYSKILTGILIASIVIIIGILVFLGIKWYKVKENDNDNDEIVDQFDDYISKDDEYEAKPDEIIKPNENTPIPEIPLVSPKPEDSNNNNNNNNNKPSNNKGPVLSGYKVVGTIRIPKTNLKLSVLDTVTAKSLDVSVGIMCGPGLNEVGNTVIAGHNFKDGRFFANNNKLAVGDKIYIKDLSGNTVTYTINNKFIVEPNDADYLVRDTKGKRGISLSTCINNTKSRLIITADED